MSLSGRIAAMASLALSTLAAVGSASAQEIILYEHNGYGGQSLRVTGEIRNLNRQGFNDRASSLRVVSGRWEICQHADFGGTCTTVDGDLDTLGSFNDQMSSVRPFIEGRRGGGGGGGGGRGGNTLTLYSGPNYTGRAVTLDSSTPNLNRHGFNDQARSIRYNGRRSWRVCQHANYGGACMEVAGDIPVIGGGLDRAISSAEPDSTNRRGNRPRNGIWLFDGRDFNGQRFDVERDIPDLTRAGFNDRADSLVIARGETWEVCEHTNFRGRCEYVDGNWISDLDDIGMRNVISSIRRVDGPYGGPGGGYPGGGGYVDIRGGVRGVDATFYARPEIRGYAIDRCLGSRGNRCDADAADRICRAAGHREARHFDVDRYNRTRTWFLGEDRECRSGRCEPIVNLLCTG